jgi:hypothetical protein
MLAYVNYSEFVFKENISHISRSSLIERADFNFLVGTIFCYKSYIFFWFFSDIFVRLSYFNLKTLTFGLNL